MNIIVNNKNKQKGKAFYLEEFPAVKAYRKLQSSDTGDSSRNVKHILTEHITVSTTIYFSLVNNSTFKKTTTSVYSWF